MLTNAQKRRARKKHRQIPADSDKRIPKKIVKPRKNNGNTKPLAEVSTVFKQKFLPNIPIVKDAQQISSLRVGTIIYIDPNLVVPDPDQPRKDFEQENLNRLADSIATDGQEEPAHVYINFSFGKNPIFCLINGERRHKACLMRKIMLYALIVDMPCSPAVTLRKQLSSNVNREPLTELEEAFAIKRLKKADPSILMEALVRITGLSQPTVYSRLKLLTLHPEVQKMMKKSIPEKQRLGVGVALEIAKLPHGEQVDVAKNIARMPIKRARRHVREILGSDDDQKQTDLTFRHRKPSDDYRVLKAFLERTADDAHAFCDLGQNLIYGIFTNRQPSDINLILAKIQRTINNLVLLEKMLKAVKQHK